MRTKRSINKMVSLLLCCVTFFSMVSCKNEQPGQSGGNEGNGNVEYELSNTKHIYDVKEGTLPFIENGKSEYTIVYPNEQAGNQYILNAVAELKNLISEASGAVLSVASDTQKTDKNKILSVGKTKQALSDTDLMQKVKDEELGEQGYLVESKDTAVYMVGNYAVSAMYAAYEFLKWQFDFEAFAVDTYRLRKNVVNMTLNDYHIVDVPDFQSRAACNGEAIGLQGMQLAYRLRSENEASLFNNVDGNTWCHNYFQLLPRVKYEADYPEWYADTQLCLNAHGDMESRQTMIETVAHEMIWRLEADPEKNWMAFSHNDGGMWCNCEECSKENQLYDGKDRSAAFATVTRFTNEVAKIVKKWNQENCPDRDIKIFIYNYGKVRNAPVKLDENGNPIVDEEGNYLPYSEELMLEDNIGVVYCGFTEACMYPADHELAKESVAQYKRLFACMKNPTIYFWCYSAQYQDYIWPMHTIDTRQDLYQYAKATGSIAVYDMAQYDNAATTDFGSLKSYVSAKLLWDCQLDVSKLVADYMEHYFQDAAEPMIEYHEEYRSWMTYLAEEHGAIGNVNGVASVRKEIMWPYNIVKRFQGYIDQAYEKIRLLEITDPELYDKLYLRILKESLSMRYVEIYLYPGYFSMEELEKKQKQIISDAQTVGITHYKEHGYVVNMFG